MNRRKRILFLVIGLCWTANLLATGRKAEVEKQSIQVQTQYGNFVFTALRVTLDDVGEWVLAGNVANETDRSWRDADFDIQLLGKDGSSAYEGKFSIDDFAKGQVAMLRPTLGFATRKTHVADFKIEFLERDSAYDFKYVISMIKPVQSDALSYSDSDIAIRFMLGDLNIIGSQLHFSLENKTELGIVLPWDKISYVDWSKGSHRVLHEGVRLIDRDKPQADSTVAPSARLDDFIYPSDYVDSEKPILPLLDPSAAVGATFSVFMPLEIKGHEKDFFFTFKVERVTLQ